MKPLIIYAAGIGFAVSLVAHVAAVSGVALGGNPLIRSYFGCAMALFGATFFFATVRPVGERSVNAEQLLAGCPKPLRYALYAVFYYAFGTVLLLWLGGTEMKHIGNDPIGADSARAFSGVAMVFYLVSFTVMLSLHRLEKREPNQSLEPTPTAVTPRAEERKPE
jgi:hypothetical protein